MFKRREQRADGKPRFGDRRKTKRQNAGWDGRYRVVDESREHLHYAGDDYESCVLTDLSMEGGACTSRRVRSRSVTASSWISLSARIAGRASRYAPRCATRPSTTEPLEPASSSSTWETSSGRCCCASCATWTTPSRSRPDRRQQRARRARPTVPRHEPGPHRSPRGGAHRACRDRQARPQLAAMPRSSRSRRVTAAAPTRSPPSTASRRCLRLLRRPARRSRHRRRSTTRCPTACTRSGRSPRSRRASTCCARSPSPATPTEAEPVAAVADAHRASW